MELDPDKLRTLKTMPGVFERIYYDRMLLMQDAIARRDAPPEPKPMGTATTASGETLPEDFLINEKKAMKRLGISEPTIKRRRKAGTLLTVPIEGTDLVRYSNNYITGKIKPR